MPWKRPPLHPWSHPPWMWLHPSLPLPAKGPQPASYVVGCVRVEYSPSVFVTCSKFFTRAIILVSIRPEWHVASIGCPSRPCRQRHHPSVGWSRFHPFTSSRSGWTFVTRFICNYASYEPAPSSIHTHSSLGTDAPSHHMGGTVHPYHPPSHHIHHNMGGLPPPPTLWGVHLLPTTTTITITLVRVWGVQHTLHTIIRITITVVVAIHYHRGICIHPPITIWRVMHLPSSRVCLPQAAVCILLP